jgi:hypothetical protein
MSHHLLVVLTAIVAVSIGSFDAATKKAERASGHGIVTLHASPSVESTILTTEGRLQLLVLWRGTPGWAAGTRQDSGGGDGDGNFRVGINRGTVSLDLWFSPVKHQARLQDKRFETLPADTNVLFIDTVDGPGGPVIVRKMTVDIRSANVDPTRGSIVPLLRSSAAIVEYLRCDVNAPPPSSAPSEDAKILALALSRGFCDQLRD